MTVPCYICGKRYEIKRKTCADSALRCTNCKRQNRDERFVTKYGTTIAKHYGAKPEYKIKAHNRRLKNYGLSEAEYNTLLEAQGGVCATCERLPDQTKRNKRLCVDHDHITGKVRGLLCAPCNMVLGMIGDDWKLAIKMSDYLHHNKIEG